MTTLAPGFGVGTCEFEVGQRMIEQLRIEPYNVRVSTLVFGVAASTGSFPNRFTTAVKAGSTIHIQSDVFVAVQTQIVLSFIVEHSVTLAALTLRVRVSLNDRARHDQLFNRRRVRTHGKDQARHTDARYPEKAQSKRPKRLALMCHPCQIKTTTNQHRPPRATCSIRARPFLARSYQPVFQQAANTYEPRGCESERSLRAARKRDNARSARLRTVVRTGRTVQICVRSSGDEQRSGLRCGSAFCARPSAPETMHRTFLPQCECENSTKCGIDG